MPHNFVELFLKLHEGLHHGWGFIVRDFFSKLSQEERVQLDLCDLAGRALLGLLGLDFAGYFR